MDEKKNTKRKVEFGEDGKTKGVVEETKEPIKVESPLEEAPKKSGEQPSKESGEQPSLGILALPTFMFSPIQKTTFLASFLIFNVHFFSARYSSTARRVFSCDLILSFNISSLSCSQDTATINDPIIT